MKNDHSQQLPLARTEQLIVKEVDDEVLVYDLKTDQAHCLNKTAALVWKHCDGEKSIAEISTYLTAERKTAVDESMVRLALSELEKFELLEKGSNPATIFGGVSRRQVIRTLGVAAVALPVIISIASPSAVEAASCNTPTGRPGGCPCTLNSQCTSNNCLGSGTCHA
jgi:hypothetical protein